MASADVIAVDIPYHRRCTQRRLHLFAAPLLPRRGSLHVGCSQGNVGSALTPARGGHVTISIPEELARERQSALRNNIACTLQTSANRAAMVCDLCVIQQAVQAGGADLLNCHPSNNPNLPPFVRHAPARARLRNPHNLRTLGLYRHKNYADCHARSEPRPLGPRQPHRSVILAQTHIGLSLYKNRNHSFSTYLSS